MSADNWAVCPSCRILNGKKIAKLQVQASLSYGKVSEDEYDQLVQMATEARNEKLELTLREDFEIGIRDSVFFINYSAWCSKCKFSYEHKRNEPIIPVG